MLRRISMILATGALLLAAVPTSAVAATGSDVEITQTAAPDPVAVGGLLTWTLRVVNHGPDLATSVDVNANYNPNSITTEFVSADSAHGTCRAIEPRTVNCSMDDLEVGAAATVELTVRVLSTGGISNTGDVTAAGDTNWANNHVTDTVTAGPAADVELVQTTSTPTVSPGGTVRFELKVNSLGPTAANGIVVADTLPAGLINPAVTPSACRIDGAEVSCDIAALAAGTSFTANITAHLSPDYGDDQVINTATVISTTLDPDFTNNTATTSINVVASEADLAVTMQAHPNPAIAGALLTHEVLVTNRGPAEATAVTLTDQLPPSLTDVVVTTDVGTCAVAAGLMSCDFGDLPPTATAAVSIEALVDPTATGTVVNTASVASDTPDSVTANDTDTTSTPIQNHADLALLKHGSPVTAGSGDEVTYTLQVENHGPSVARSVSVADHLPDGLDYVAGSCGGIGSCDPSADGLDFDLGTVEVGQKVEVTYRAVVAADAPAGTITNVATVSHAGSDPVADNDQASFSLAVDPVADLELATAAAPATVIAGESVTFTTTVTNAGPSGSSGLVLTGVLPSEVEVTQTDPGAGICQVSQSSHLECSLASLAADASWEVTVTGRIDPDLPRGSLHYPATVAAPNDPTDSNNTDTTSIEVDTQADLAIELDAPATVVAGTTLQYELRVTNAGPSTAADVVVTDLLPEGVTLVSSSGDTCSAAGKAHQQVRCLLGKLDAGAVRTVSMTVAIDAAVPDGTQLVNRAQVSSPTLAQPVPIVSAQTAVVAAADLSTTMLLQPQPLLAGAPGTYLIRVRNTGSSDAATVSVRDLIPDGLHLVEAVPAGGACAIAGSQVECTHPGLSAGAVWSLVVRVDVPPDGSGTITNTATAATTTAEPDVTDNAASVTTTITQTADVAAIKSALFDRVLAGQTAVFFLSALNYGPGIAAAVTLTDTFPAGLVPTAVGDPGCSLSGQQVRCEFGGLASGEVRTVMVTASVPTQTAPGELTNSAIVASATDDEVPGNNLARADVTVAALADLGITKTVDRATATPGAVVGYTITVTNAGPSAASSVTITDLLPLGLSAGKVEADGPLACGFVASQVDCAADSLAPGTYRVSVGVTVASDANGRLVNVASVAADTADPGLSDNRAMAELLVEDEVGAETGSPPDDLAATGVSPLTPAVAGVGLLALLAGALLVVRAHRKR